MEGWFVVLVVESRVLFWENGGAGEATVVEVVGGKGSVPVVGWLWG